MENDNLVIRTWDGKLVSVAEWELWACACRRVYEMRWDPYESCIMGGMTKLQEFVKRLSRPCGREKACGIMAKFIEMIKNAVFWKAPLSPILHSPSWWKLENLLGAQPLTPWHPRVAARQSSLERSLVIIEDELKLCVKELYAFSDIEHAESIAQSVTQFAKDILWASEDETDVSFNAAVYKMAELMKLEQRGTETTSAAVIQSQTIGQESPRNRAEQEQ